MKSICVFCSASNEVKEVYKKFTFECSKLIAKSGYDIVYGGSCDGLMGVFSKTAINFGSKVTGVFPLHYLSQEKQNKNITNMLYVDNLLERKQTMINISDMFLILPGGFGTLDELFEVWTLKNLNLINKPIIILNYLSFWTHLLNFIKKIIEEKFAPENFYDRVIVINDLDELSKFLDTYNDNIL